MAMVMSGSILEKGPDVTAEVLRPAGDGAQPALDPLVDPRWGDVGDDASSTKRRSLLAIAGSLLVEISLPKLLFAALALLWLPAVLLGIAPLVATAWFAMVSKKVLQ